MRLSKPTEYNVQGKIKDLLLMLLRTYLDTIGVVLGLVGCLTHIQLQITHVAERYERRLTGLHMIAVEP